jgi:hypothetical protein
MVIWRVRRLSCDGGHIGRTWSEIFFTNPDKALTQLRNQISKSDKQNPKYPYKTQPESVENVIGYCNWQFGTMIALDSIKVQ